jgi:N-hydroxyarylamine O-acetyltransferase
MTQSIDLNAYFRRIGYAGAREATLDTLAALQLRHVQAIAFENLNPLLGWPVRLDPASLERKLVHDGRGGYCYEQNLLFGHVLRALGFRVTGLAARVLWTFHPEDAITARSHQLLRVELEDGPYLVDVGFGGQTLTGPLRLEPDLEQATPHESFRVVTAGDGFKMQCMIGAQWKTLYRFDLQEVFEPDYKILNYYASTHPDSLFVNSLLVARPATDRRYALFNNRLAVHHLGGLTERRVLETVAEVRETLESAFLLRLPHGPELDRAIARLLDFGIGHDPLPGAIIET